MSLNFHVIRIFRYLKTCDLDFKRLVLPSPLFQDAGRLLLRLLQIFRDKFSVPSSVTKIFL